MNLFELIVSLGLALVITLTGVLAFQQALQLAATMQDSYQIDLTKLQLKLLAQEIAADLDSNPFRSTYQQHPIGKIFWNSQQLNSVSIRRDQLKQHQDSQAISLLKLDFENLLKVKSIKNLSATQAVFSVCNLNSSKIETIHKSYLGIDTFNLQELELLNANRVNPFCLELKVKMVSGLYSQRTQGIPALELLLPIESNYTLYQDQALHLRKLTHLGETNRSNQKILELSAPIKIQLEQELGNQLKVNLNFPSTYHPTQISELTKVPRVYLLNFIFPLLAGVPY